MQDEVIITNCNIKNSRDYRDGGDTDDTTNGNTRRDEQQMFQLIVCESGVPTDHAVPDIRQSENSISSGKPKNACSRLDVGVEMAAECTAARFHCCVLKLGAYSPQLSKQKGNKHTHIHMYIRISVHNIHHYNLHPWLGAAAVSITYVFDGGGLCRQQCIQYLFNGLGGHLALMHDLDHKDLVVTPPPALKGFAKGPFSQLLKSLILDVKGAPVHMPLLSNLSSHAGGCGQAQCSEQLACNCCFIDRNRLPWLHHTVMLFTFSVFTLR